MPLEEGETVVKEKPNINMKKYAGLLHEIGTIKDHVENERQKARDAQEALKLRLKQQDIDAQAVQKDLSVQLRVAGRSYQQMLNAIHEVQEELVAEKELREREKLPLIDEIRALKKELGKGDGPWKAEIAKRDLKIAKLQEAAADQESRLREALDAVEPVRVEGERKLAASEAKTEVVLKEVEDMKVTLEEINEKWEKQLEEVHAGHHTQVLNLKIQIQEIEEASSKIAGPYVKQIKELEQKTKSLELQLSKVDYEPFLNDVRLKEEGYEKLVKDFRTKEQTHSDNVDRMRQGFEEVIEKLDKKLQGIEKEYEKKLEPWAQMVEEKEAECVRLNDKIKTLMEAEGESRNQLLERMDEMARELEAAKKGVDVLNDENTRLRKQIVSKEEEESAPGNPKNRLAYYEMRLDEVTKRCEVLIKGRDRELAEKTNLITKLQQRLLDQSRENIELDRKWDNRVQIKEEGYGIVVAQLKHAEGQILEERERTAQAKKEIKKRDQKILDLQQEHREELKIRARERVHLVNRIRELEDRIEAVVNREDEIRRYWEEAFDSQRLRSEQREADLEIEIARRDKAKAMVDKELAAVRAQFEKARLSWDTKERELEVMVRARDRLVNALKNEIELVADSWEIKYNKLMSLFDKLQKKYDELLGPGGLAEALRRARDLKEENIGLTNQIHELKEMIKKQKRQIRDLQLDIDMHLKETADLIAQKERGIAEMVGDFAKLQTELRKEQESKEKITKELLEEKRALVASFQARIEQLEQLVEAMRFTDREELVDTIDVWKRAYERICIARDELEEDYQAQILTKDKQLRKMALDNAEEKARVEVEMEKAENRIKDIEIFWKKKMMPLHFEKEELNKRILELERLFQLKDMELSRAKNLADSRLEDPEKDALKERVKELEGQLAAQQAGINKFIEENNDLRQECEDIAANATTDTQNWEPQIKWRDERYEAMVKEHEQVKRILYQEMLKAQETCKAIEDQVRKFPNPFEAEIEEMKARYAQMQAGTQKLSVENVKLREQLIDQQEQNELDREKLEEQILVAHHILQQVATLGALKQLSKGTLSKAEKVLGMDLNNDGKVA